jgi:HK97 family phage major capsid protein/HK97 family phage prohead protease
MSYKPTEGMVTEAQRGLDWRSEHGRGGTAVGIARARDIVSGKNLSEDTVLRMYSFFSRHEVDKQAEGFEQGEEGYPSNGRIAWALWGGNAGFTWSKNIRDRIKKDETRAVTDAVRKGLAKKAEDHNKDVGNVASKRTTTRTLISVFNRGIGAYKTNPQSVRPSVKSPEQWAYARVNSYLYALRNGKFRSGKHDTDLLPSGHPMSSKKRDVTMDEKNDTIDLNEKGSEPMKKRHVINIEETEEAYIVTFAKPMGEQSEEEAPTEEERFVREDMERRGHYMDEKAVNIDERRVKVGVSTEEPVERSFGMEVIDHSRDSMNLDFLNSGRAPLLLDHDMEKQIGVIEGVELDEDARRLRAMVRFGKGGLASEVFNDVTDGIRQNISVGYRIDGRIKRDDDPEEYYRVATTPMEISIVSVPADQSSLVGVGRSVPAQPLTQTSEGDEVMTEEVKNDIDLDAVKADAVRAARKNDAEILALAAKHNKRDLGNEAIASGMSVDQFRGNLLDAIGDKPLDITPAQVDAPVKEQKSYSLGRMIQAQITGDWRKAGYEREINDEIATRVGRDAEGVYVPDFAWGQRGPLSTAATGGSASEVVFDDFVPTEHRGDMFIEALRARQVLGGLGATYLSGLTNRIKMPKLATGANAAFVEELADVGDGAGTDGGVTLQPRTMGAFVDMSRLLMLESVPAIEQIIRNDLLASAADRTEFYAIQGSGSGGQPTGILNTSGVNNLDISTGTDVDALTWADIIALVKLVEEDNGIVNGNAAGFLSHPAVKAKLASTAKVTSTDSVMILNDPWNNLYGYPMAFTSNVPTTLDPGDGGNDASALIFGDFSQLMIAQFGAPSILVDPYSGSKAGTVRMVLHAELDVGVRNAVSFGITDEVSVA